VVFFVFIYLNDATLINYLTFSYFIVAVLFLLFFY